ncbi:hypothetical protein Lepto7375DRAFT_4281 [Leptolyngbya sp. PCC 7375]|nr:hypothetical protein Lepto7375DRAFT_4281 [Leptolyngbya sp. PCC 7375]
MVRKRPSITLTISDHEKAQLEALAMEFGQTWGDKPNVSKLIKAIANGKLLIANNHDWSCDRTTTLNQALNLLKDGGYFNEAMELAHLLLERSELNHPLRQEIQTWVDHPGPPWRTHIDSFIRQVRPFRLTYQDAADRIWSFTVRHAIIQRHEDRQYLDCWCDETQGNQDIAALHHNWCLRLDRIPNEAVITPIEAQWKPQLDHIEVEFHLINRLAVAYRSKKGADLTNEWLPEQQIRRVTRQIQNTFWFFREIRRYDPDCIIIGPEDVRARFIENLTLALQNY